MLLSAITPNKLRKDSRINGLIKIQLCDMPFQNDADWTVNPLGPGTTGGHFYMERVTLSSLQRTADSSTYGKNNKGINSRKWDTCELASGSGFTLKIADLLVFLDG